MGDDTSRRRNPVDVPAAHDPAAAYKDQWWAFAQQSLDHAILLMDSTGVVRWASPGAAKMIASAAEDAVGLPVERFFTPGDRDIGIPAQERTVAESVGSAEDDRWMQRLDGSRFWASGVAVALRGAEGQLTGFAKIMRDFTDVKMQTVTLRNRIAALQTGAEERNRAMALLSHELRNPLATMGMAAAMLRKVGSEDSRVQLALGMLDRNIGFASRLMDDLDDVGRVTGGKFDLQISRVSLHELLQSAIAAACERFGADRRDDIDLLVPTAGVFVDADPLRLQQVFVNLIGNAIKFTSAGERIWVVVTIAGTQVLARVSDEGIGIAPDRLEHIFEMFTQAHHPKASRGLGIGLAVVKNLVELHGGTVQARSEGIGKGSTFTVRLPLLQQGSGDAEGDIGQPSNRPA